LRKTALEDEESTFKVRIWAIKEHVSKAKKELEKPEQERKRTYSVRWIVEDRPKECSESFSTFTAAESRHMELTLAVKKGEAFHVASGLPMSEYRQEAAAKARANAAAAAARAKSCLQHFIDFMDEKWSSLKPKSRESMIRSLATAAVALTTQDGHGAPNSRDLYYVLNKYALNKNNRELQPPQQRHVAALAWAHKHSLPEAELRKEATIRLIVESLKRQPSSGGKAARNTVKNNRSKMHQVFDYLVEQEVIDLNPLENPKWKRALAAGTGSDDEGRVDRSVVANPVQVERLITKAGDYPGEGVGQLLQAFFALLYYGLMRPGEALVLREDAIVLPPEPSEGEQETGWATITFKKSNPQPHKQYTDDGKTVDDQGLKHREDGEGRTVLVPPPGVRWLRRHLKMYSISPGARLFVGRHGGKIDKTTYAAVWRWTRKEVFTAQQHSSLLAKRPYDLRHGGVSLMLNAGVDPALIAEMAGHSIDVLLKIYSKCIDGQQERAIMLVNRVLAYWKLLPPVAEPDVPEPAERLIAALQGQS